ncbi:MAG TPA: Ig-like domain-containing protein [bacterium]|nr:Ig-like domain-containing protein [bacterium]
MARALKKLLPFVLAASLVVLFVACNEKGSLNQGHKADNSSSPPATPPSAITIDGPPTPLARGQTFQFHATARYGISTADATNSVDWNSDDPSVIISATGLATATGLGTAHVRAQMSGVLSPAQTVTVEALSAIAVTSSVGSTAIGLAEPFTATGTLTPSGATVDVTDVVTWSTDNGPVATVGAGTGIATGVSLGSATITATAPNNGAVFGSAPLTVEGIASIAVTPSPAQLSPPELIPGLPQPFKATATLSGGGTVDATQGVAWSTDQPTYLSLSAAGVATGVSELQGINVIATDPNPPNSSGSVTVNVEPLNSIAVTVNGGGAADLPSTGTLQLQAMGSWGQASPHTVDMTTVAGWTSSNTAVATVDAGGNVSGVAPGVVTITANGPAGSGVSGALTVTVSPVTFVNWVLKPSGQAIQTGASLQYVLMEQFSDGSFVPSANPVTGWSVTNGTGSATIDGTGLLTAVSAGTATVTVDFTDDNGNAASRSTSVTVVSTDSTPPSVSSVSPVDTATEVALDAVVTATFSEPIAPATLDTSTFTVSDGVGPITGTVTYDPGTLTATFTPSAPLQENTTYTADIAASVTDLAGNALGSAYTWGFTSVVDGTPPTVVSTSPAANATNVADSAVITATFSEPIAAATLTGNFTVSDGSGNIAGTVTYDAPTRTATFTPASPLTGNTVYTAKLNTNVTDQAPTPNALAAAKTWSFATTPVPVAMTIGGPANVLEGLTAAFSVATVTYSDGTTAPLPAVTWSVTNGSGTATVNAGTGVVTGGTPGTVTVTATHAATGVTASAQLTVVAKSLVSLMVGGPATVGEGGTASYSVAGALYDNGDTTPVPTVTWSVTNGTGTSTIDAAGLLTAGTPGTVTVTATEPVSGVVGSRSVTVQPKTLTAITITGDTTVLQGNTTAAYSVSAVTYNNGDTTPVPSVTWGVTNGTGTASINASGVVTGGTPGTVTVTATATDGSGVVSTGITLTVTGKSVTSLTISGDTSVYAGHTTAAYTVTGVAYDNGDTSPIPTVNWSVTNGTGSATINSSTGVVTGVSAGTVTVKATEPSSGTVSNSVTLTVQANTVTSLTISGDSSVYEGASTAAYSVAVIYNSGDTSPILPVTWSVTNGTGSATINSSTGVLTGVSAGTVTVKATEPVSGTVSNAIIVNVLTTQVSSLTISGATSVYAGHTTAAYTVTAVTYNSGATSPIPTVTWSVTNGTGSATVNASTGVVTGVSAGTVSVTATATDGSGVASNAITLTVNANLVTSLTISGATSVPTGVNTPAYTVTAVTYNSGDTSPIPSVTWSVAPGTGTATVNASTGVVTGGNPGTVTVTATEPVSGKVSNGITLTVQPKTVTSLTISGDTTAYTGHSTTAYAVSAVTYNTGETTPTPAVTWSVTNGTGSATINSSTGVVSAVSAGTVSVTATATDGSGVVSNAITLTIVANQVASLTISGDSSVYAGENTAAYAVTGVTYNSGDTAPIPTVTWSVSNGTGSATVNASTGVVTGVSAGSVTVTATATDGSGTVSNGVTLTVNANPVTSLTITGDTTVLEGNSTAPYTVSAVTYTSGATSPIPTVTWSVTPGTGSATINASTGVVTAVSAGTVTVKATEPSSGVVSNAITLTIGVRTVTSMTISGDSSVYEGSSTTPYTVTAVTYSDASTSPIPPVTWSVTNGTGAATVNASTGVVTGITAGTVTVTATNVASGVTASLALTVTAKVLVSVAIDQGSMATPLGVNPAFTATGTYNDASTADVTYLVNWASGTPSTATIGLNSGLTTTKSVGTSSITATAVGGGAGGVDVVSPAVTLTVDPAQLASIIVTPNPVINALPLGVDQQFTATGTNTDGTSAGNITASVNWASSNPAVATINAAGLAAPVAPGTTVITATDPVTGVVSGNVNLTVVSATLGSIAVTPDPPANLPVGNTQQFTATGTLTDASSAGDITTSVTWSSSNTAVATVSATGLVTAVSTGTVNITATSYGSGAGGADVVSPAVSLTVDPAVLVSLTVSAAGNATTVPQGGSVQLGVIGTNSDGTTTDETNNVTWVYAGTDISINASGLLTGNTVNPTPTAVAATLGAISSDASGGSISMQVVAGSLVSIAVSPSAGSVFAGQTLQFTAIGTFADGSTADLSPSVTWSSDATGVATVDTSGLATAVAAGTANISATDPMTGVSSTQPGGTTAVITVTASAANQGSAGSPLAITPPYTGQVAGGSSYYVISGLIPGKYYSIGQTTLNNDVYLELYPTAAFTSGTATCYSRNYQSATANENCVTTADSSGNIYVKIISLSTNATYGITIHGPLTSPYWVETFQNSYSGTGGKADTVMQLYSAGDTTNALSYNDDVSGTNLFSHMIVDLTPGQTYYIKVTFYGSDDGGYSVKVNNIGYIGGDSTPNPAQSVNEPNDTPGTATVISLNTQSDNALRTSSDTVDWFKITIP